MEISLSNVMELSKFYNNQIFKAFTFFFKVESHFIPQRNSKIILYFNSKLNHSRKIVNIYIYIFSLYLFFASTLNLIWKTFRALGIFTAHV